MTQHNEEQLTEEQMNELVFADVNDPSAWGESVVVEPSKGPRRIKGEEHLELASNPVVREFCVDVKHSRNDG